MASESNDPVLPAPSQVKLQLTTRHADIALPENTGPILVNTHLRRYALSTLVNTLLQSGKPIPFEFLINGTFLRTSIEEYLTANGISSETTLTVEYVRAMLPPTYLGSLEHDDWVSAVDVLSSTSAVATWEASAATQISGHERILSASFDGLLRVWNMSSEVLATSGTRLQDMSAAKFLSSSRVVSAYCYGGILHIWKYDEDTEGLSANLTKKLILSGHRAGVESLAVHQPSSKILTASNDGKVGIWSTKKSVAPELQKPVLPTVNKRPKLAPTATSDPVPRRGPLALLEGHSDNVRDVIFAPTDPSVAYSVSMDNTLRTWDLVTQTLVDTRSAPPYDTLDAVTALPTLNLIAAGSGHGYIHLMDPRTSATTVTAMTLRGHFHQVASLARDPGSEYGLLSGSHDGWCRLWDVRASKLEKGQRVGRSVFKLERETSKGEKPREMGDENRVFCVHWDKRLGILSGGRDGRVQINSGFVFDTPSKEKKGDE